MRHRRWACVPGACGGCGCNLPRLRWYRQGLLNRDRRATGRVFIVGHSRNGGLPGDDRGRTGKESQNGCENVADSPSNRSKARATDKETGQERNTGEPYHSSQAMADTNKQGLEGLRGKYELREGSQEVKTPWDSWWAIEPDVGRVAHGVPSRVDRLRCLGNAVVPAQIYPILKAIAEIESRIE